MNIRPFDVIVIGCSAGGYEALRTILSQLPGDFAVPIIVVSHAAADSGSLLSELLAHYCSLAVYEAQDKAGLVPGLIHVAPGGYHLLLEVDGTLSLSVDPKVCGARPSINVLFESAADAYASGVIGVILTGANDDGACGLRAIQDAGGVGIVQDPEEAYAPEMPAAAILAGGAGLVASAARIADLLQNLVTEGRSS